jgi:hypothetical protein
MTMTAGIGRLLGQLYDRHESKAVPLQDRFPKSVRASKPKRAWIVITVNLRQGDPSSSQIGAGSIKAHQIVPK